MRFEDNESKSDCESIGKRNAAQESTRGHFFDDQSVVKRGVKNLFSLEVNNKHNVFGTQWQ